MCVQVGRLVSELLANEDLVVVTRELQLAHPSYSCSVPRR